MTVENVTTTQPTAQTTPAPTSAAPAAPAPANPAPATTPAPAAEPVDSFKAELSAAAKRGVANMTRRLEIEDIPQSKGDLPEHLLEKPKTPEDKPLEQASPAPAEPAPAPVEDKTPDPAPEQPKPEPEPAKPVETSDILLRGDDGKDYQFTADEVKFYIRAYAQQEQAKAEFLKTVEAERAELAKAQDEVKTFMESDNAVIMKYLAENDAIRKQVLDAIEALPDGKADMDAVNAKKLEERIAKMEADAKARAESEQNSIKQAEIQAKQRHIQDSVTSIKANVNKANESLRVPLDVMEAFGMQAAVLAREGKLNITDAQQVTNWMLTKMNAYAEARRAEQAAAASDYIRRKGEAPPPPPTGGVHPSIQPTAPLTGRDRIKRVADVLRAHGAKG